MPILTSQGDSPLGGKDARRMDHVFWYFFLCNNRGSSDSSREAAQLFVCRTSAENYFTIKCQLLVPFIVSMWEYLGACILFNWNKFCQNTTNIYLEQTEASVAGTHLFLGLLWDCVVWGPHYTARASAGTSLRLVMKRRGAQSWGKEDVWLQSYASRFTGAC